jgi:hypothetical protein
MNFEEANNAYRAKGFVWDGTKWSRPARAHPAQDPGAAQSQAQDENAGGGPPAELPHTEFQECEAMGNEGPEGQTAEEGLPDYIAGVSEVEGEGRPEFRITVTLLVSNHMRRDPLEPSKLLWILSRLPADDSVNDLPEGSWKVIRVPPDEEGAIITIERLK